MDVEAIGAAVRLIDDARDAVAPATLWPTTGTLVDSSLSGAQDRAALGRSILTRFGALNGEALPEAIDVTLRIIAARAETWVHQAEWYWTVFDPSGGELFAMFAPTAYGGSWVAGSLTNALARAPLDSEAARQRYLAGLHDLGDVLDIFAERTRGQAERGIFMPREQAEASVALLRKLEGAATNAFSIDDQRLKGEPGFKKDVIRIATKRIAEAYRRAADDLGPEYLGQTGNEVGLMHYPDGAEIYAHLLRLHGSTTLTPREVHEVGLEKLAGIRSTMADIRRDVRFDGDDLAYRANLDADPLWRAESPTGIEAVFNRYVDRFRPHVDALFNILPKATYGVRPLPDAMSAAMTFGYYEPPSAAYSQGTYVFNARNLGSGGLCNLGSLNYHELVPGHHLHLALQQEDLSLPLIRQGSMPTAYVEGWAEYAVTLAEEAGMFAEPGERFGRLVNEAFLATRLVVDTGLNALGWSLNQAREFMRQNSFYPETEICSETLRYGADIPGQALAYKLGDRAIMAMRERMREVLGDRFDIRDFHDAVLTAGAMPIPMLATRIEARTQELLGSWR